MKVTCQNSKHDDICAVANCASLVDTHPVWSLSSRYSKNSIENKIIIYDYFFLWYKKEQLYIAKAKLGKLQYCEQPSNVLGGKFTDWVMCWYMTALYLL